MPDSDAQGKDVALEWYQQIKPATVVDIGAGSGTYARLMRPTQAHWTAVEAWAPYVSEFGLEKLYKDVIVADARDLPASAFLADLVIAGDVLEHMTQAEARALMVRIGAYAKHLIISIPVLHLDQGAVNGNPYERHVEHWTYEDMRDWLASGLVEAWRGDVLAYYWWSAERARAHVEA